MVGLATLVDKSDINVMTHSTMEMPFIIEMTVYTAEDDNCQGCVGTFIRQNLEVSPSL